MKHYAIEFGSSRFDYYLGHHCLTSMAAHLATVPADQTIIISDSALSESYGQRLRDALNQKMPCHLIPFQAGETYKTLDSLAVFADNALKHNVTRQSHIVALGGGITGNIAGLLAALLYRGIRWSFVPTSLMAILDAALSLKQAVNFGKGKNILGVYYAPEMVLVDTEVLATLPARQIRSGVCEVIKNNLIIDASELPRLLSILNEENQYTGEAYHYLIEHSIRSKLEVMRHDPKEAGKAVVLEYGHTIGHAIELAGDGRITHGDAVGLGMLCAAEIAYEMGFLDGETVALHLKLLHAAGVPMQVLFETRVADIVARVGYDNKRGYLPAQPGHVHMVLLTGLARPLSYRESIFIRCRYP